jgi:CDP-diacylglycerol--glycerol-3-phosphate 3-phosphatidyltransferase
MYLDEMFGAVFVLAIAGVLCAYAIRTITIGRAVDARVARVSGTVLLGRFPIEAIHWAARGAGFFLVRKKVSPDALTLTSLVITSASIPLIATRHHLLAGCVFLFGASFDALDGIVARARGLACQAGEVLDAIVDRYSDAAPLIGVALYFRQSTWSLLVVLMALLGSMMVPYVRAKHESVGVELPAWLMRRPERVAYLGAGLICGPLIGLLGIPGVTSDRVLLAFVALVGTLSHLAAAKLVLQGRAVLARSTVTTHR